MAGTHMGTYYKIKLLIINLTRNPLLLSL